MAESNTPVSGQCPHCGGVLGAGIVVDDTTQPPAPTFGDISVCFVCGGLLVFDTEMRFVEFTGADLMQIPADEREGLLEVQRAVRLMRARGEL